MKSIGRIAVGMVLVAVAVGAVGAQPLDISGGFNFDIWCGPLEFQALLEHERDYWGINLIEMEGDLAAGNGPEYLLGNNSWLVASSEEAGLGIPYSIEGSPGHPRWLNGNDGFPQDGVLLGQNRVYMAASALGNWLLPGDWTETPDTGVWTPGGAVSGTGLDLKFNVMCIWSEHNTATFQIAEAVAELPDEQKGYYLNVNFILCVRDGPNGGRHARLYALYGDGGTDEELLYAWDDSAADLRPQADGAGASYDDFTAVYTSTKYYDSDSGQTGDVLSKNYTLYEFSEPFRLNWAKVLYGFRLADNEPATNWQKRGLGVFAATAVPQSNLCLPSRQESTVTVEPQAIPLDGSVPCKVTIASRCLDGDILGEEMQDVTVGICGDGTTTISFIRQVDVGVYETSFTCDTVGPKQVYVHLLYAGQSILLDDQPIVTVFDSQAVGPLVADAGPDQVKEDLDESGDESVTLNGSTSTDGNGSIVSYVWSSGGQVLATGVTAQVTLPLGASRVTLTVTDNDGYCAADDCWVIVPARGYDSACTPLSLNNGFNVDAWCGPLEYAAALAYTTRSWSFVAAALQDIQGDRADGVGWHMVPGTRLMVGNCPLPYSMPQYWWWHPQYVQGDDGTPPSGYLAGCWGVDYFIASYGGNPLMPGDWLEVANPAYYPPTKMPTMPNAIMVGAAADTADWQMTEVVAELPVEQQAAYEHVNFILAALNRESRASGLRIAAVYTDDSEDVIWAFPDEGDTTAALNEVDTESYDCTLVCACDRAYCGSIRPAGAVIDSTVALYEFATPLSVNSEKTLRGFRFYDSDPARNGQARGLMVLAAAAGVIGPPPPGFTVSFEDDLDWVYENIPASTGNGGHKVLLTVTPDPPLFPSDAIVTVSKEPDSGPGEVVIEDGPTPLQKYVLGCARADNHSGALSLRVTVCFSGYGGYETHRIVPFECRLLGDIDANGGVEPGDLSLLIKKLNANPDDPAGYSGYHFKAFDLDANTGVEPGDMSILINILNGLL